MLHISPTKFRCTRSVSTDAPIELEQPKNIDFENMSTFTKNISFVDSSYFDLTTPMGASDDPQ